MNKKIPVIIVLVLLSGFLISCISNKNLVKMNGDVTLYLEVYEEFVDPGITMPENFTLTSTNDININRIGVYEIQYRVLDDDGVIFKEMIRIVNIVDSIPPEITLLGDCVIHLGIKNDIENCYQISDNYYDESSLIVTTNMETVNPNSIPGFYTVEIEAKDLSDNIVSIELEIEIVLDYSYILQRIDKTSNNILSITFTESGGPYQKPSHWINFWNGDRLNISNEGDFYYVMSHSTIIGSGLLFFSGEFSNLTNTSISISIKKTSSSESSWLILNEFDASLDYDELNLSESTFTNNGSINYDNALITFNEQGLIAINKLKFIYEKILGLRFND